MAESKELRNFNSFIDAAGFRARITSIVETNPPKPDIEAKLDGKTIAWEMTEAVEPHVRRKLTLLLETPKIIRNAFASLPA